MCVCVCLCIYECVCVCKCGVLCFLIFSHPRSAKLDMLSTLIEKVNNLESRGEGATAEQNILRKCTETYKKMEKAPQMNAVTWLKSFFTLTHFSLSIYNYFLFS